MKTALLIISLLFMNNSSRSQDQSVRRLSISDFEKTITPQMGYDTIISRFGVPDHNTGSGIYILIYNLVDSTSIVIGCDNTRILYARSRDRNGDVRDIIPLNQTEPNKKKLRNKKPKHNRSVMCNCLSAGFCELINLPAPQKPVAELINSTLENQMGLTGQLGYVHKVLSALVKMRSDTTENKT